MTIKNNVFFVSFLIFIILSPLAILMIKIKSDNNKKEMSVNPINSPTIEIVRNPAVAGIFYPQDKDELNAKLEFFLSQAEKKEIKGIWKIFIAPHAGIDYSGRTAAWIFKQLEKQQISKVILIGVSHQKLFTHAAVYDNGAWQTPLGKVLIDSQLSSLIIDEKKNIISDLEVHKNEHSLEIELIFLQKVLADFKIVPILVSQPSEDLIDALAEKISQQLDDQTVLLVSSDLSHYPSWETAKKVDREIIDAILTGQRKIFDETVKKIEQLNLSALDTCACGQKAIDIALKVAQILSIKNFQLLKYENSGDISGEKQKVVGYAAIGAISDQKKDQSLTLDEEAQKEALTIARKTLEKYYDTNQIISITSHNRLLQTPLGAFVTLRKNHKLRGCIGEFEPKIPLYQVIQQMAIAAATKDSRFPMVTKDELKDITIEISVLKPKRKINNYKEIILGKHGVVVQKGHKSGTFLPQVASETNWSKEEFLTQLCIQKAGLPKDCYKDSDTSLYVFEAQVFEEKN